MANLNDNTIMILHYMLDHNFICPNGISPNELQNKLRFVEEDFFSMDLFLLQSHFIDGGGNSEGIRWLTPEGVRYITEELKMRVPITLDAERVLRFLIRNIKDNDFLTEPEIIEGVNIPVNQYHEICRQLADFDFVDYFGSLDDHPALIPKKEGRLAIHRNFQENNVTPSIQTGPIFYGPISGGNIQAVGNAFNSNIQQNISSASSEELQNEISQVLNQLIEELGDKLSFQQKAAYLQLAADLQKEITQSNPDPGVLHKLLAGLGFFADLGGTMDFGTKIFALTVTAGPYIIMMGQIITQLLKNSGH